MGTALVASVFTGIIVAIALSFGGMGVCIAFAAGGALFAVDYSLIRILLELKELNKKRG